MFRKGAATANNASHLCSMECTQTYFGQWAAGELPEIEAVQVATPAPKSNATVVVPPDAEDAAMRNQILASVIGRG